MSKILLSFFFFISFLKFSFAQDNVCGKKFSTIEKECLQSRLAKFEDKPAVLTKSSKNQIYFTASMTQRLVKLRINSVYRTKNECTVYMDVGVFDSKKTAGLARVLSIKQEFGAWSKDDLAFDTGSNKQDLLLENRNGKCVLISLLGKMHAYKKIDESNKFEGSAILYYSSLFLIFLAIFLITQTIFSDDDKYRAQEKLEDAEDTNKEYKRSNGFVLKYSRPFFKRYVSPVVGGMKNKKAIRLKYRRSLASAGLTKELSPEDFFAFKLFLIIGFPILFLGLRSFLEADWPLILTPLTAVLGFFYPNIWIRGKIEERQEEILRSMPFIVDMLALSVEAGLDFMAAIVKVIEKAPLSALTDEFEILIKDTRLGASRAEGLRQMAWRVDVIQISSFCATLIAADSVGASVGPILKSLSAEMRQKRSADAEKKGATAATKILFPMIALILPAILIVIALPFMVEFF